MTGKSQYLRYGIRLAILAVMILIPVLSQYRIAVARGEFKGSTSEIETGVAREIIHGIDAILIGKSKGSEEESERSQRREIISGSLSKVQGNVWSLDFFGISWTDPLAGFESIFASRSIVPKILVGMIIPIALALILGRVFCSWICPAGLLFEFGGWIRGKTLSKQEGRKSLSIWRGHKFVLLGVGLIMSFLVGLPLLGMLYPPAMLSREIHLVIVSFFREYWQENYTASVFILTGSTLSLLGILVMEVFVAPRVWCRSLCPGGALQALLGSKRFYRVQNDVSICTLCTACIKACPMGLDPMGSELGMECDNCLACFPVCDSHSLTMKRRSFLKRDNFLLHSKLRSGEKGTVES